MNIETIIKESLKTINELENINLDSLDIIPISGKINGHYCLNFAFKFNLSEEIQKLIQQNLQKHYLVKNVERIKKYINIELKEEYFTNSLQTIINNSILPNIGNNVPVNIEYCSVNPTGYLHVGHARNAILGDSIARILAKTNYNVTKEYYINDGGNQIDILAKSIYSRYCELNKIANEFPENGYIGKEILDVAKKLPKNPKIDEIKTFAVNYFMQRIKNDLKKINIIHDVWSKESDIIKNKYIEKAIEILQAKDAITYGTLEDKKVNKGEISKNNLLLLKTSNFGDEQDRPLTKANGDWTYLAPDIGYHLNKIERKFNTMICVLGSDHDSYAKRMKIAVHYLNQDAIYQSILCQMVSFENHGKLVKFSKRKGNSIRIRDFVEQISPDVLRFMILEKSNDTQFVFNYEDALNITIKNPTFYCQYAYARACSIIRNYEKTTFTQQNNKQEKDDFFSNQDIQDFILLLEQFKNKIAEATNQLAPNKITNYLKRISEKMHKLWQIGKENGQYRIIMNCKETTNNRIILINAYLKIAKECFECLGIEAKESM